MKIKKLVDRTLVLYLVIGILNFIVCTALMFFLFNVCGFSEHIAPLVNYGLGSLIWYLACRYVLFPTHPTTLRQLVRFVVEILVCYLLAYYIVAPLLSGAFLRMAGVREFFSFGGNSQEMISGNCEMTIGAFTYALLNYFGQRYFVFSDRFDHLRKSRERKE